VVDQIRFNLTFYQDVSTSGAMATGDDRSGTPLAVIAPPTVATKQIFIIKITFTVTTVAAKTVSFQDSTGSPVVIAEVPASQAVGPVTFDFGPDGYALPVGAGLNLANSGAGVGGAYSVTAYQRDPAGTITPNVAGSFGGL
jgi:hypothetical protein